VEGEVEFNPAEGISLQYESKLITIREKNKLIRLSYFSGIYVVVTHNNLASLHYDLPFSLTVHMWRNLSHINIMNILPK
jgi:hypothetical protein